MQSEKILGWGVDLELRPGVPKEWNHENVMSPNHHVPILVKMKPDASVNLTLERSSMPPIYGRSVAARPVSSPLRNFAFRFSEDSLRHWMLLLFADRVNMVEGWFEDLSNGVKPMLLPRMEFRTTDHLRRLLKQGPKSKKEKMFVATVAIAVGAIAVFAYRALRKK